MLEGECTQALDDLGLLQYLLYLLPMCPMRHLSLALHMFISTYMYTFTHRFILRAWMAETVSSYSSDSQCLISKSI